MLTKLRNKLHMPWGRGPISSIVGLPKLLSGAELARSSWASRIESYADLSDAYKSFFDPFLFEGRDFPYTVLTPSHERFIHRQSEKLISDFGREIYILERNGSTVEPQCYPVDGISYIEFRTALLASSFKICGMTSEGVHTSSTLIFNSISDYLFKPLMKRARLLTKESGNGIRSSELEKFDHLIEVNFKFMNFAKRSLLGGETVIQSLIQPEIKEGLVTFLKKTYFKTISPTHMSILTDREFIIIQEDAKRRKEDRYGGIWDYIPLNKIVSSSVKEKSEDMLMLTVQLPENTRFELLFQASAKEELNRLLNQFKELTAK